MNAINIKLWDHIILKQNSPTEGLTTSVGKHPTGHRGATDPVIVLVCG